MKWITRERPVIDRIACPWLVARFIDRAPEFLFVPRAEVLARAGSEGAIPFDVPDVRLTHDGERCSFDAFLREYALDDPALARLALVVRGADTDRLELAPQAAGLLAISLGMGRRIADDHALLDAMFSVYDALYAWARDAADARHGWNPDALRARG